jgi:hypothetical protein
MRFSARLAILRRGTEPSAKSPFRPNGFSVLPLRSDFL